MPFLLKFFSNFILCSKRLWKQRTTLIINRNEFNLRFSSQFRNNKLTHQKSNNPKNKKKKERERKEKEKKPTNNPPSVSKTKRKEESEGSIIKWLCVGGGFFNAGERRKKWKSAGKKKRWKKAKLEILMSKKRRNAPLVSRLRGSLLFGALEMLDDLFWCGDACASN